MLLGAKITRLVVLGLITAAETWRRPKGENQLPKIGQGVTFRIGVEAAATPAHNVA